MSASMAPLSPADLNLCCIRQSAGIGCPYELQLYNVSDKTALSQCWHLPYVLYQVCCRNSNITMYSSFQSCWTASKSSDFATLTQYWLYKQYISRSALLMMLVTQLSLRQMRNRQNLPRASISTAAHISRVAPGNSSFILRL